MHCHDKQIKPILHSTGVFMISSSRRDFVIRLASVAAVSSTGAVLSACGGGDPEPPHFDYGVASGDPLA
jgi:alkaline phosphatase D